MLERTRTVKARSPQVSILGADYTCSAPPRALCGGPSGGSPTGLAMGKA